MSCPPDVLMSGVTTKNMWDRFPRCYSVPKVLEFSNHSTAGPSAERTHTFLLWPHFIGSDFTLNDHSPCRMCQVHPCTHHNWTLHTSLRWGIYTSRIHWVTRGTGSPQDKDEVNRREVSECDGWVCDLDVMVTPSKLRVTRRTVPLVRMLSVHDLSCEEKVERWKWNWSRSCCLL